MSDQGKYVLVNTTYDDRAKAEALVQAVLERHLAACVHMIPISSRYWWKGRLESAEEVLLSFKTSQSGSKKLQHAIRDLHSYETPEIVELPITDGDKDYLAWITSETSMPS